MDKEIASIMFVPVCTKCWKIIWQEIDVQQRVSNICGSPGVMYATYDISPNKCPHCGALFDNVTIPTRLPFNAYDYVT